MYLATGQPARRQTWRRTLGDDMSYGQAAAQTYAPTSWLDLLDPASYVVDRAEYFYNNLLPPTGSTPSSVAANLVTGAPTNAQIAPSIQQCVAAIQNMRAVAAANGQPGPPAGAESQCSTDQQAYTKLIGGTANQILSPGNLLSGVLPSASDIPDTALLILGCIVGLIALTRL